MQPHIRRAGDDDGEALSILNAEIQAIHAKALPLRFKAPGPDTFPPEAAMALLGLPQNRLFLAEVDDAPIKATVTWASRRIRGSRPIGSDRW